MLEYRTGIGWVSIQSHDSPGRVRVTLHASTAQAYLELMQQPTNAAAVNLTITPACILSDERDRVTLTADVMDEYGSPVVDGTLVTFSWEGGHGYGQTIDGRATLRLPAPPQPGRYLYTATSDAAHSSAIPLQVTATQCSE
jgi:hypothetical protein